MTLDAIHFGFSVIFIFQSRFKVYLFHSLNTKGLHKIDAPTETPDFIGGFAVSTVEIFTSDFADVKKVEIMYIV